MSRPRVGPSEGPRASVAAEPRWARRIEVLIGKRRVSVAVTVGGVVRYGHRAWVQRVPASSQKLLLSMALLERVGPTRRLPTRVAARRLHGGVVRGNLWILGGGDPEVGRDDLRRLARAVRAAGIRRVRGSVIGSTEGFRRDWWAPGWRSFFPGRYVALPTALVYEGNRSGWTAVRRPERLAAQALTRRLRAFGVRVDGRPGSGRPPDGIRTMARVRSAPLVGILRRTNRASLNFHAEVLTKLLGARLGTGPGSLETGARAIEAYAAARGIEVRAFDGSGLSYRNGIAPRDLAALLDAAGDERWGSALRGTLAAGGRGTLRHRLLDVGVRAKTGTLVGISSLSGWVRLERSRTWATFSIMSRGMSKSEAVALEDRIVRLVARRAS